MFDSVSQRTTNKRLPNTTQTTRHVGPTYPRGLRMEPLEDRRLLSLVPNDNGWARVLDPSMQTSTSRTWSLMPLATRWSVVPFPGSRILRPNDPVHHYERHQSRQRQLHTRWIWPAIVMMGV